MAPRAEQGSTLSAHRAFVVHLGTGGGPGRRRFSGRVEHLSSGESMHFSSLKGLLAFFAAALDAAAGVALRVSHDLDARSVLPRVDAAQPSRQHPPRRLQQHGKGNRP